MTAHPPQETAQATGARIAREFQIEGRLLAFQPLVRGHIHETFVSSFEQGGQRRRYLHQRLNPRVFTDIPALMHNVAAVTAHLCKKPVRAGGLEALELVPTRLERHFLMAPDGPWRTYRFVEGTRSVDRCGGPEQAFAAARAFGCFLSDLADLPAAQLRETIPAFFSAPHRLRQFDDALASDPLGRAAACAPELAFVAARRELTRVFEDRLAAGTLPRRIVHGDTKLNNVLFDERDGRARCVVDLDTCMPAWTLYDFGDLVRFTAATCPEDHPLPAEATVSLELYKALRDGFLSGAERCLTAIERRLMPTAARLVTFMIGLRFLTDHLSGDVYFRIHHPGHNLERARIQFALVADLERRGRDLESP
jgi:hypothetical protein